MAPTSTEPNGSSVLQHKILQPFCSGLLDSYSSDEEDERPADAASAPDNPTSSNTPAVRRRAYEEDLTLAFKVKKSMPVSGSAQSADNSHVSNPPVRLAEKQ